MPTDKRESRRDADLTAQTPLVRGKLRAQRDDERPTEDDIAKARLGEQGIPDKPPKAPVADADELQIPKLIDPGHIA